MRRRQENTRRRRTAVHLAQLRAGAKRHDRHGEHRDGEQQPRQLELQAITPSPIRVSPQDRMSFPSADPSNS